MNAKELHFFLFCFGLNISIKNHPVHYIKLLFSETANKKHLITNHALKKLTDCNLWKMCLQNRYIYTYVCICCYNQVIFFKRVIANVSLDVLRAIMVKDDNQADVNFAKREGNWLYKQNIK